LNVLKVKMEKAVPEDVDQDESHGVRPLGGEVDDASRELNTEG
jgi:hypothetical protein